MNHSGLSNVKETKQSEEIQSFQKLQLHRIFKSAKYHRSLNLTSLFYREEKKNQKENLCLRSLRHI